LGQASPGPARGRPHSSGIQNHLATVRLRFEIPSTVWLSGFTRRHPDLYIEVHNTTRVSGKNALGEFEVYGPPRDWSPEIARFPDVRSVERLQMLPGLGRYRVRFRLPVYLAIAYELELHLRYPRGAKNGGFTCETIARPPEVRRFVSALRAAGCRPRVVSARGDPDGPPRPLLTQVQRALFRHAMATGYFEVPRRITLTALARRVSRNKSSVSRTLAVVERKFADLASRTIA
jgi:hypothetical protein